MIVTFTALVNFFSFVLLPAAFPTKYLYYTQSIVVITLDIALCVFPELRCREQCLNHYANWLLHRTVMYW